MYSYPTCLPYRYEYRFFSGLSVPEEGAARTSYGIRLYRISGQVPVQLDCIPDITTRRDRIVRMTDLLNRTQVSPLHFRDVLDDLLASRTPDKRTI